MAGEHEAMIESAKESGECPRCSGSGWLSEAGHRVDCPSCDGGGTWEDYIEVYSDDDR